METAQVFFCRVAACEVNITGFTSTIQTLNDALVMTTLYCAAPESGDIRQNSGELGYNVTFRGIPYKMAAHVNFLDIVKNFASGFQGCIVSKTPIIFVQIRGCL